MFSQRWLLKTFYPIVAKARASGVDPKNEHRFVTWLADHRNDNVNILYSEVRGFMNEAGAEMYAEFVDDAIEHNRS